MKKVYIAGALNADAVNYIKNMHRMIRYADQVRKMGFYVFVPCLDFLSGLVHGNYDYADYFENNQEFLKCCDYVFVVPGSEEWYARNYKIDRRASR